MTLVGLGRIPYFLFETLPISPPHPKKKSLVLVVLGLTVQQRGDFSQMNLGSAWSEVIRCHEFET